MKKDHICLFMLLALIAAAFTSCSDDDELSIPPAMRMTSGYVKSTLNGKGWTYVESHRIKSNGNVEKDDYWDGLIGGGPENYSFTKDTMNVYMYIDAYPIWGYRSKEYTFNEETNQLMANEDEAFKILYLNENEMHLIKFQAITGNGERIYVYAIYKATDSYGLASLEQKYPHNIDKINEYYPALPEQAGIPAGMFAGNVVGQGWKCTEAHRLFHSLRYCKDNSLEGATPVEAEHLYITADSITWLQGGNGKAPEVKNKEGYTYMANGYYIHTETGNTIRLVHLGSEEMGVIKKQYDTADGKNKDFYCIYRKMTTGELAGYGITAGTTMGMDLALQ